MFLCTGIHTKKRAKVQQIFGMYKNFMQKIKFICSFCVKGLSFAQLCDSTFGGFLISIRACRRYNKFCYKYLECTRILCKKSNLFGKYTKKSCIIHKK